MTMFGGWFQSELNFELKVKVFDDVMVTFQKAALNVNAVWLCENGILEEDNNEECDDGNDHLQDGCD